ICSKIKVQSSGKTKGRGDQIQPAVAIQIGHFDVFNSSLGPFSATFCRESFFASPENGDAIGKVTPNSNVQIPIFVEVRDGRLSPDQLTGKHGSAANIETVRTTVPDHQAWRVTLRSSDWTT